MSSIDEKKQSEDPDDKTKWNNFFKSLGISISSIIGLLVTGSLFMYTVKVARANLIQPNFTKSHESYPVNMNFFKNFEFSLFGEEILKIGKLRCQSIKFTDDKTIWETLLEYIKPTSNGVFGNFIYNYLETFTKINNYIVSEFFKKFYNLNESFVIFLGGIIYLLVFILLIIFNFWSSFFTFMYNLFGIVNDKNLYASTGENKSNIFRGFINICLTCIYYWFALIPGSIIGIIISSILCILMSLYSLISPLTYSYKITTQNENNDDKYGIFRTLFINLPYYKKSFILFLCSMSIILNAGNELGTIFGASAFLAVIILLLIGGLNDTIDDDYTLGTKLYKYK